MKKIIKSHIGLLIAVSGLIMMPFTALLFCKIDVWMNLVDSDGDGPGSLLAIQCMVLIIIIGIIIECLNPFEDNKTTIN